MDLDVLAWRPPLVRPSERSVGKEHLLNDQISEAIAEIARSRMRISRWLDTETTDVCRDRDTAELEGAWAEELVYKMEAGELIGTRMAPDAFFQEGKKAWKT